MARNHRKSNRGVTEQQELFPETRYLTAQEVADLLGVPKSFVYRRTARGHPDPIAHYRFGGHLRFQAADVEEWIARHRVVDLEEWRGQPSRRLKRTAARKPRRSEVASLDP